MSKDSRKSIFQSARQFASGTVLSRSTGLFRDMAMAFSFGTEPSVAALFVAYRLSHLLRRLLGEGAMQSAFIPHFESLRSASPKQACRFFGNLYASITLLLVVLTALSVGAIAAILSFYSMSQANRELLVLLMLLMPSLLFICLYGLNASLLQCEKEYWLPSLAPIGFNMAWTIGALLLWKTPAAAAMPWLAGFIVFGCFLQWAITLPRTINILRQSGLKLRWIRLDLSSIELRSFAKPLMLGIAGVAASQINNALDPLFARFADLSGPALLWYSIRIQQLPLALFGVAISGALLPPLSRAHKKQDLEGFRSYLEYAISRGLLLIVPMMFLLLTMGDRGIDFLYGRGDFGMESILGTTWCLWAYALGLIPMALVLILAPAFYAQKKYRVTTIASISSVGINIFLNSLFIFIFYYGAISVAVATSLSAWVNFWILLRRLEILPIKEILQPALKISALSILAALASISAETYFFSGSSAFQIFLGEIPSYSSSIEGKIFRLFIQGGAFLFTYSLLIYLFFQAEESDFFAEEKLIKY